MKTFRFKAHIMFEGEIVGWGDTAQDAMDGILKHDDYDVLDRGGLVGVELLDDGVEA